MRARLLLAFLILLIITLVGVSVFIRESTANQIRQFVNRGGEIGLDSLVNELETYYLVHQTWSGVQELLISSGNGSGTGGGRGAQSRNATRLADSSGRLIYPEGDGLQSQTATEDELDAAIPLHVKNELVGYLLLPTGQVLGNGTLENSLMNHLDEALWRSAVISGLVALVLAFGLAGVFLKPIQRLTLAAASLAKGNLDERVPETGSREIKTLAATFNQMAAALQRFESNRKAMTADIAHELRTPLAVQKINLEALQDGVYPMTMESLQPILEQNEFLTRLVQDLRTLSLAEAGELSLEKTDFNILPVLQSLLSQFQRQAQQRQIDLSLSPDAINVRVNADRTRIAQIGFNLLQNALRHTPVGSQVQVRSFVVGKNVHIEVRDTGKGISEEAMPYIFERFYKADKSRSRSEGGTGLGLAIAKQLAQLNGGELQVRNHPQGGAVFTLILPQTD